MELFRAQKIAVGERTSTRRCHVCGETQEIVRLIVDADTGDSIQMFECADCGERNWDD